MQVRTVYDARTKKTVKRQLWSDELDLSSAEQAKALNMYLAVNPWADEVKPASHQVHFSACTIATHSAKGLCRSHWQLISAVTHHAVLLVVYCKQVWRRHAQVA